MQAQARAPRRLADLVAWIAGHLEEDLSVPALAERAAVSERQLARLFRDGLGESPAISWSGCGWRRRATP